MELTLTDFVLFTLLGSCALVVVFTLISRTAHARAETRSLARRVVCRLCLYAFEDSSREKTALCPHCGTASEKGRSRRLG
jgi:predicted Zn-ribbon and HTH transcriptional regulator